MWDPTNLRKLNFLGETPPPLTSTVDNPVCHDSHNCPRNKFDPTTNRCIPRCDIGETLEKLEDGYGCRPNPDYCEKHREFAYFQKNFEEPNTLVEASRRYSCINPRRAFEKRVEAEYQECLKRDWGSLNTFWDGTAGYIGDWGFVTYNDIAKNCIEAGVSNIDWKFLGAELGGYDTYPKDDPTSTNPQDFETIEVQN